MTKMKRYHSPMFSEETWCIGSMAAMVLMSVFYS
jgi:hypothetical protein